MVTVRSRGGTVFNIDIDDLIYIDYSTNTEQIDISKTQWDALITLVNHMPMPEKRVPAIRVFRLMTGLGLKEAKDLVDMVIEYVKETGNQVS